MNATEAQFAIAAVLSELERATGQHVRSIEVRSVEITRLASVGQEWARRVVIDLMPVPGSTWETK